MAADQLKTWCYRGDGVVGERHCFYVYESDSGIPPAYPDGGMRRSRTASFCREFGLRAVPSLSVLGPGEFCEFEANLVPGAPVWAVVPSEESGDE